jgi:replicative DNA helicase
MASAQITSLAFDAPEDTKEVVDSAERMILSVTDRDVRSNYISMQDAMQALYAELQAQAESGEEIAGVRTGFQRLDDMLLGMREGQMVVVGARPGVGKTSFALNLAVQAAEAGATVAFFSLEMSSTEIAQRLLSAYSQVPLQKIRSARIAGEDWTNLMDASARLSQLDILIDDTPGTTVTEVRAKARRMLRNKEKAVIILDYLQLVSPPPSKRSDSRATEVSEMSRGIKIMAKDLRVPVVALSQLNRTSENRTGKRPQLSDLRESGSIEQDADIVILLDRSSTPEEAERADRPDEGITEFIVAKNRSGPVGTIEMVFLKESTRFMQLDRNHDA